MKFSLYRKELKALSRFSATRDVRYYLCGIHVVQNNRGTYLESTDGCALGRFLVDSAPMPDGRVIIGNDAVDKLAASGRKGDEWLHFEVIGSSITVIAGNDRYTFAAVDGTFPDVDRIMPLAIKPEDQAPAAFNPDYLVAFQRASEDLRGVKKNSKPCLSILQRGNQSAIVNIGDDRFVGIIMPLRDCNNATVPDWCHKPAKAPEAVAA